MPIGLLCNCATIVRAAVGSAVAVAVGVGVGVAAFKGALQSTAIKTRTRQLIRAKERSEKQLEAGKKSLTHVARSCLRQTCGNLILKLLTTCNMAK